MKKLLLVCLASYMFADNFQLIQKEVKKEEPLVLLKKIKEKNGLILTEEEVYVNKMKKELIALSEIYKNNKVVSFVDYVKMNDYFKKLEIDNIFNDKIFKINEKDVSIKELLFNLSLNGSVEDLEYYLKEVGEIPLKAKTDNLIDGEAKFKKLFTFLIRKNITLDKESFLLSLENLLKYNALYDLETYSNFHPLKFSNESFLFFVANENEFNKYYVKSKITNDLYEAMNKNDFVIFEDTMVSKNLYTEVKEYGLRAYKKTSYKVKTPFISYLLKANKKEVEYNKNIADEYFSKYGMSNIEIEDIKEYVRLFLPNGDFYKEMSLTDFEKRFIKR